ncbi:MAG: DHHW family protein [Bacilli bacterium]|nr:DHHW family protein [Bacilli bacterium]MDD3422797.1 DHHW family protein [Bacilli bacterium]MDD4065673.1 DHHW family protein [Bacilli bacterium]
MKNSKDKILTLSFIGFLCTFFVINLCVKDQDVSVSERRKLQQFPNVTLSTITDGSAKDEFEDYTVDQFAFRDFFRRIKANINYKVFGMLDNNGVFIKDDYIFKTDYPTKTKSVLDFTKKIQSYASSFSENNHVYYAIIPDKNYYLNTDLFLNLDYDYMYDTVTSSFDKAGYDYIELRDVLKLEDYYKTDTHWKQENLAGVVDRIGSVMNLGASSDYQAVEGGDFYGVYYGQAALNLKPDKITYLTNEIINDATVSYLEDTKQNQVYIPENLTSLDSYNVYLDGPSSLITITNPHNTSGKELIVYRDSFGSSLTPLLIESYSKITVLDTRYITSSIYQNYLEFTNQDVLFLYSTMTLNNSDILKN